jgi:bifunctional enzyme CysN/CysC
MITGAARAEAALLVIDAHEGVQENSRRHGYMMSMLGIRQLAVLVNKMDLVSYDRRTSSRSNRSTGRSWDSSARRRSRSFPVAGRDGDHIVERSRALSWYQGPTVLEALDAFATVGADADRPFRMPVQDVYKFTSRGDSRRIVAGTIESGSVRSGDEVVFYPSGKRSRIRTLEAFNRRAPAQATGRRGLPGSRSRNRFTSHAVSWRRCRASAARRSARGCASACSGWAARRS